MRKVSVTDAAKSMGVTPQFVRLGLQQQRLPIGYAVKMDAEWSYYISPVLLEQATGIKLEGSDDEEN